MNRTLANHLYAAGFGRDLVLLDLRAGRYDLLAGAMDSLSLEPSGQILQIDDQDLDQTLEAAGVFSGARTDMGRYAPPSRPCRSALYDRPIPITVSEGFWMVRSWILGMGGYCGRGLPTLIRTVERVGGSTHLGPEAVLRKAAVFDQMYPWIPFQGVCMFRCFLLLMALKSAGAEGVRWVFGVRTWPFQAHCWLQMGDIALTDYAETLSIFAPIAAV